MLLKPVALAAALIDPNRARAANSVRGRRLQSCDAYDVDYTAPSPHVTILWDGGAGDSDREWMNKDNWQYDFLPGADAAEKNRLIMAVNDKATVHCDATYMVADVSLEARSGATLDVSADLNIGGGLVLKNRAVFTQFGDSHVAIGKNLYLAAQYSIADQASLSIDLNLYMASNAKLTINGDSTSITASNETPTTSEIHGEVIYALGPAGTGAFDLRGPLTIGSTTAKLTVNAASYAHGPRSIPLIKYASRVGTFTASVSGLGAGLSHQVVYGSDGLYLVISGANDLPSPTRPPTLSPIRTPTTVGPSAGPIDSPTSSPVTDDPSGSPVKAPSSSPVDPTPPPTRIPSQAPTTGNPSQAPTTRNPSAGPVRSPTEGPVESTSRPSDGPVAGSVTRIVLTESGFDPITSAGTCPPEGTTSIEIDGSSYADGPGTIALYDCALVNDGYDLMDIRLENFEEGLWFEIVFDDSLVNLEIKSLTDYSEYWNRVRHTYVGDYPESGSTAPFPKFSWDTIPTWVRYRKNLNLHNFSDDELESIADHHHLSWYGLNTPDHVRDIARRIKFFNQNHTTMLYWNAESYWGMEDVGFDESWLTDETGTGDRGLYDYSNPDMRRWWHDHAVTMSEDENIDGVFTDNTLSPECDNGGCDLEQTEKSVMIRGLAEDLTGRGVLNIGNYLRQYYDTGNRFRLEYADGSYFENQHKATGNQPTHEGIIVSMQLAREASWKKKVVMWTGSRRNCGCGYNHETVVVPEACVGFNKVAAEPTDLLQQDLDKSLGEFLMIVEEYSYINFSVSPDANCERWRWDASGMEAFARPLGRPLGPPLKSEHSFSRHFEHLSVKVNVETEETTFVWH